MRSHEGLSLPTGVPHAGYIEGMREIVIYEIKWDCYVGRWDTMINGKLYFYYTNLPPSGDLSILISIGRAEAIRRFKSLEV